MEDGFVCGRKKEMEGETRDNTRSCGWCEARIQAVVDQNTTQIKDPVYTSRNPKAKTVEIRIM